MRRAKQCCHRPSFVSCLCLGTGSPCKLSSRLISKPTAELRSGAEETEKLNQAPCSDGPGRHWLRHDKARDTPRAAVKQPNTSGGEDTVQGKDHCPQPLLPFAVLMMRIFIPGKPWRAQHVGRALGHRPSPSQEPPCPAGGTKHQLWRANCSFLSWKT